MSTKMPQLKFKTDDYVPCKMGEIVWVFIDQPGTKNLKGKMIFKAALRVKTDSDECKALQEAIREFWKENKPKGAKLKSLGFTDETIKTDKEDEDGEPIREKTGFTLFNFWTGTHWPDGNPIIVKIHNAKGNVVSLGGKKIGNGTMGSISGTMQIYDSGPSARGVTIFLNAIQITKFVEYSQDAGFAEQDDEEGWTGEDDFEGVTEDSSSESAKPRI